MAVPDKTAIVTGASAGLGMECARSIVDRDPSWQVVLAVRDTEKGREAARQFAAPERATAIHLDLASLASVHDFVKELDAADLPPVHALICNAGVQVPSGLRYTTDGYELTFGTNHLGHFALVSELFEQLVTPARIVVVSSDTHDPTKLTGMPSPRYTSAEALAHPDPNEALDGRERYTTSKLCNVLYAYELDRRSGYGTRGVTAVSFNPGMMPGSGLAREYGAIRRFAWRFILPAMRILPSVRSTSKSGEDLAALAIDPEFDGVTGQYFDGLKSIDSSTDSHDDAKARDLWETSERLTARFAQVVR